MRIRDRLRELVPPLVEVLVGYVVCLAVVVLCVNLLIRFAGGC